MEHVFSLIAKEFIARSSQIRHLFKAHAPSIGSGHEVLLRTFLAQYLPKFVSVGHGFIRNHDGVLSAETDLLVYDSAFYAPLYRIEDFVIVQPESVVAAVEIKTTVTKRDFYKALDRLVRLKNTSKAAHTSLFLFYPPRLSTLTSYLTRYDCASISFDALPDDIVGLCSFVLGKMHIQKKDGNEGIGYVQYHYEGAPDGDIAFEHFYYYLYSHVERHINSATKAGIDNVWMQEGMEEGMPVIRPRGRLRYKSGSLSHFTTAAYLRDQNDADRSKETNFYGQKGRSARNAS